MENRNFATLCVRNAFKANSITTIYCRWVCCFVFGFASLAIRQTLAEGEISWAGPGCVLLKNGNVLMAINVAPQGQQVTIKLDQAGEVRIPTKDVVAIGRDKIELYNYQVSAMKQWGAGEHWHLAKWCLRQGLVEQSKTHYDKLKTLSGDHTKFKQLDAELKQALLQDPVVKAALQMTIKKDDVSMAFHSQIGAVTPSNLENVQSESASPALSVKRKLSVGELTTDHHSQDYFRQQIQPFLAMRCGQAGCHGAMGKSDFHVAKGGSMLGQRSSDLSYTSAVRFINSENIEETKLWLKATTAHGMQGVPSLDSNIPSERELLNRLQQWHYAFFKNPKPNAYPTNAVIPWSPSSGTSSLRPTYSNANALGFDQNPNKSAVLNSQSPASELPDVRSDLLTLEREIAKLEEKERARNMPNRHDPEEFNRQFGNANPP